MVSACEEIGSARTETRGTESSNPVVTTLYDGSGAPRPTNGGATNDSFHATEARRPALVNDRSGAQGEFAPPRLSGRSAFSNETFARRFGNKKDAPKSSHPIPFQSLTRPARSIARVRVTREYIVELSR